MDHQGRREQMLAHVTAQEQSGLSCKAYCAQHGIREHVLYYWRAKSKGVADQPQGFAQVQLSTAQDIELQYPNGVRLVVPAGTALDQLAACIRVY